MIFWKLIHQHNHDITHPHIPHTYFHQLHNTMIHNWRREFPQRIQYLC